MNCIQMHRCHSKLKIKGVVLSSTLPTPNLLSAAFNAFLAYFFCCFHNVTIYYTLLFYT